MARERHRALFFQHVGLWCALCRAISASQQGCRGELEREQRRANKTGKDGKLMPQKMRLLSFLDRRMRGRVWLNFGKSQRQKLR